ncbi:MAG: hypothetical protein IAF02_26020 [Anaerolineae bacterium]|nr:hypothetical protein [Anaerolineae bacterium]
MIEQRGDQDQPRYGSHNLTRHYIQNEDWYHELETAGSPLAASVRANITYWREYLSQRSDTQEVMRNAVWENILRAVQISLQLPQQNSLATEHIEILR